MQDLNSTYNMNIIYFWTKIHHKTFSNLTKVGSISVIYRLIIIIWN